jgi:hypothetical protein
MITFFVILDQDGQPLCGPGGKMIEWASRAEAEQALEQGQRVMPVRGKLYLQPAKKRPKGFV